MAIKDGELYELRSMLNNSYAVDVAGNNTVNGTNIRVYPQNGSNAQKFWALKQSNDTYVFAHYTSNKALDVKGGVAAAGTNIQLYQQNGANAQKFRVVSAGTRYINGVSCDVVHLVSALTTANTYYVDTNENKPMQANNMLIWTRDTTSAGQLSQQWALLPTDATDPEMPVPYNIGLAQSVGGTGSINANAGTALYPRLEVPNTFIFGETNLIEWRIRTSYMDSSTSTWGAWSAYSAWKTDDVTAYGRAAYLPGINSKYSYSSYKNMRVEIQARCQSVKNGHVVHGGSATQICYAILQPTVALGNAAVSPAGLTFDYVSDYNYGTTRITFSSIKAGNKELLIDSFLSTGDSSTSVTVPMEQLKEFVEDGTKITMAFNVGNDQLPMFNNKQSVSLTVAQKMNSAAAPTVIYDENETVIKVTPKLAKSRVWMEYDGVVRELNGEDGTYVVPFPMVDNFKLWSFSSSNDGDTWAVWHDSYGIGEGILEDVKPCHAWATLTGGITLDVNLNEALFSEYQATAISETNELDSRAFQTVSFAPTQEASIVANGALQPPYADKQAALESLVGIHCIYRSPLGRVADVAVTGVSIEEHKHYATVTVDMTREG